MKTIKVVAAVIFAGPRMIELYKSIKRAFDDKLILNPGKMIKIDEN